jgi:hypothetical protein
MTGGDVDCHGLSNGCYTVTPGCNTCEWPGCSTNRCYPSIIDVSTNSNGFSSNCNLNNNDTSKGYGAELPPPCGLNTRSDCGSGCCWDTTLCFPIEESCKSGDNSISIPKFTQKPTLGMDTSIALCIWNYTVQNVISKFLKFVASYYDWLYCQIGLYQYNQYVLNALEDTNTNGDENQQLYARLAQNTGFNRTAQKSGNGFAFAPQTFLQTPLKPGAENIKPVVFNAVCCKSPELSACTNLPVGESTCAEGGCPPNLRFTPATLLPGEDMGQTCPVDTSQIPTFQEAYGGGLAPNPGNAYTPPAKLTAQVFQFFGWMESTLENLDVASCVCGNICNLLSNLVNLDSGSKTVRDFILSSTLGGSSSSSNTKLGCGNLYNEGVLVDSGDSIVGLLELIESVFNSLGVLEAGDTGEALLAKLCQCMISAAAGGTPCNINASVINSAHLGSSSPNESMGALPLSISTNCWGGSGNSNIYVKPVANTNQVVLNNHINNKDSINVIAYQEIQYRMQFFAAITDLLQYVLFDRDCEFKEDDKDDCSSCTGCTPTAEDWLTYRCKKGTGDGNCVVCSGACAGFRRKDNFNPLTSITALKYWLKLLTLDRSDQPNEPTYCQQVDQIYNEAITAIYNAYKDSDSDLTFVPDCGAPQFCCTTQLAANSCEYDCCSRMCKSTGGNCLLPVPAIDLRKAGYACGGCGSAPYTPVLGNCFRDFCINDENLVSDSNTNTFGDETVTTRDLENVQWSCYTNPCVVVPYCCDTYNCDNCCQPSSCEVWG